MSNLFWEKVAKTDDGCWAWIGPLDRNGYGLAGGMKKVLAHRMAYRELVGEIPAGLGLDHLCRNRACVRPDHLEPVSHRENCRRGNGWAGTNARKTHCPQGHEYTPENTKLIFKKGQPNGGRNCRECRRVRSKAKCKAKRDRARAARLATGWVPWARVAKKADPG